MDSLETLTVDKNSVSVKEAMIADELFPQKITIFGELCSKSKYLVLLIILFVLFSLPQTEEFIVKFYPDVSGKPYVVLALKAVCFALVFFALSNIHLVRR